MSHLCATGPNAGQPHHWDCPPAAPRTPESGVCRWCGAKRLFTNAEVKGSWATMWAKRKAEKSGKDTPLKTALLRGKT